MIALRGILRAQNNGRLTVNDRPQMPFAIVGLSVNVHVAMIGQKHIMTEVKSS